MEYADFDLEDFLKDASFKHWVYAPTPETDAFWRQFLHRYPEKQQLVDNARMVLRSIDDAVMQDYPDEEQVGRMFRTIQERIQPAPVRRIPINWRWLAAASLLLGLGLWVYQKNRLPTQYEQLIDQSATALLEKSNPSDRPLTVRLPDRSTVLLQPNSRISFARHFGQQSKREVYLTGEAFFQVTKNPDKPFFVYADELVTKVLGTSFWIKAVEAGKQVVVQVKTGKVSVFARTDSRANAMRANRELEGVVLTPNQQLAFSRDEVRMKKSLVAEPEPIQAQSFAFKDTPVSRIFSTLEEAYGIDIVYDEELLGNCLLTASLTDEPLFDKLTLLCKGIEGHYEVVDAQIVITAKGCQ
ncbi:FecR family protein [Larkinella knui]|uniref:FecR family protein n=1 Tax=Larkinella knui TaxID=2025310 RepID=A0A3P1CEC4_9BACT|nr:FecR family protein [Larkinella knui]RRB11669.1 FecR family protein [Larkinella knui]